MVKTGLPRWLSGKESTCNARATGDTGSIPGSGRSPGGRHGNPLQYSCLEKPMDRGAWQATVHEVKKTKHSMHAGSVKTSNTKGVGLIPGRGAKTS